MSSPAGGHLPTLHGTTSSTAGHPPNLCSTMARSRLQQVILPWRRCETGSGATGQATGCCQLTGSVPLLQMWRTVKEVYFSESEEPESTSEGPIAEKEQA